MAPGLLLISPAVLSRSTYHRRMSRSGANIASIGERLRSDLMLAMRARDDARTRVLRSALAAIDNAGAVAAPTSSAGTIGYSDVPRRQLDPSTIRAVLEAEILEREAGIIEYQGVDRPDEAETLRAEIATLRSYLVD
jgi:uncharacterized protein YqeY